MKKTIKTQKIILVDESDPNAQIHLSLKDGKLTTEKQTVTIEKVELNSITEL